ncbi:MAG TPA: hypothetical protein VGD40_22525 [Chryseosolibacter sp.]
MSEASLLVNVSNILLELADENYVEGENSGVRTFIILSDSTGAVVAHEEFTNGRIVIDYPDGFNNDLITLTSFTEVSVGSIPPLYIAKTFADIRPGKYRYRYQESKLSYPTIPKKVHTLRFPDAKAHQFHIGWNNVTKVKYASASEIELTLAQEGVDIYLYREPSNGPQYALLRDVKSNVITTFDDAGIEAMPLMTSHILALSSPNVSSSVYGLTLGNRLVDVSFLHGVDKADIHYPAELYGNYFKEFITIIAREVNEGAFKATISTSGPTDSRGFLTSIDNYPAYLTAVKATSYPTVSIETNGNVDIKSFFLRPTNDSDYFRWNVWLQGTSINLPTIPQSVLNQLKNKNLPELTLADVTLIDVNENLDYSFLITGQIQGSYSLTPIGSKSKRYELLTENVGGGRAF